MIVENLSFPEPQANLNYDEELLRRAENGEGSEYLRFWEAPSHFVVLGRTSVAEDDVELAVAQKDNIPVLRRSSGGGTVLQGPGCLNFAVVLAMKSHPDLGRIQRSYGFILKKVMLAVKALGVDAEFRPVSDLVVMPAEKKFSGNAQRRGRRFILHHGTILYDFDLSLAGRYLKMPKKMPDYRASRSHADFIANIPVDPQALRKTIQNEFNS
jgi:lipoate---protein ligase